MDDKIKDAMGQVYTGESKALLRLQVYAKKAEEEGYPQMAKLFRVVAFSEWLHGSRALKYLKEIKGTEENLKLSFESETRVAGIAYEQFIKTATELDDTAALTIFAQSRDVEEVHAKLYKEAMNHLMEEKETTYWVCNVCGYVSDGVLPDVCPVCQATKDKFVEFK
jgi:rubrerythrin